MVDQNLPSNQSQEEIQTSSETANSSVSTPFTDQGEGSAFAPPPPSTSSIPNVVVTPRKDKLPYWFYFVLGITLIIFIVVTTLLIKTLQEKGTLSQKVAPTLTPIVTPFFYPSPTILPTLTPATPSTDSVLLKLNKLKSSD
jgi:hypothetical protein